MLLRSLAAIPACSLFVSILLMAGSSGAITIDQLPPADTQRSDQIHGLSLTTSGAGPWNDLEFNLYAYPSLDPIAGGNLFLLTMEYLGTPGDLSGSTPGFVAQATGIVDDKWQFDSAVTLAPNTQYWFYTDTSLGEVMLVPGTASLTSYLAFDATSSFVASNKAGDFAFLLQGNVVPEASTGLLFIAGLSGLAVRRRTLR